MDLLSFELTIGLVRATGTGPPLRVNASFNASLNRSSRVCPAAVAAQFLPNDAPRNEPFLTSFGATCSRSKKVGT